MNAGLNINTDILTWAIVRAGYELHEFATKAPSVLDWIKGTKKPTVKQLEKFAKKVYIPFGYLFLSEPPKEKLPIPFFRTNGDKNNKLSINVYDTILLMQQRQSWLKDYLENNGFEGLPYVGKYAQSKDVKAIVSDIRSVLGLNETWASSFKTWEDAQNHLVEVIEDKGIIAVFNGVVGNDSSRSLDVEDCRGFVLVDKMAPFIFINNADSKAAQMFTIIHELAHIWTGHSAGFDFRKLKAANNPIEQLCDQVAAEFLVPQESLNAFWKLSPNIKKTAQHFKVSEIVAARRALDTKKITQEEFLEFYNEYINREYNKKEKQTGGGNFYATAKKRLSITFAAHVHHAVKTEQLLYRDAYKLTSMKGDTFEKFFTKYL